MVTSIQRPSSCAPCAPGVGRGARRGSRSRRPAWSRCPPVSFESSRHRDRGRSRPGGGRMALEGSCCRCHRSGLCGEASLRTERAAGPLPHQGTPLGLPPVLPHPPRFATPHNTRSRSRWRPRMTGRLEHTGGSMRLPPPLTRIPRVPRAALADVRPVGSSGTSSRSAGTSWWPHRAPTRRSSRRNAARTPSADELIQRGQGWRGGGRVAVRQEERSVLGPGPPERASQEPQTEREQNRCHCCEPQHCSSKMYAICELFASGRAVHLTRFSWGSHAT